ncbi:hypothetical protein Calag_0243 [Caldisphaera lagunensis DSM 15908]|uniref:Uncharacterized protein n=1 Tax=Caldisphaera lagunensis (strain DSM 15908 / JCM 11604 / ANMR 0165 / IC-154) TaxID=1056495 RepID=L0AAF7_CALLD|nr:hypothetical protein [Caldisphaera lagunensis]AFZ70025.1 hypothetical protein Calag_0243 [Caldisphaera lagunensis DSM 15908]
MTLNKIAEKLGYNYIAEISSIKIYVNSNYKSSYIVFQNDYPMMYLSKINDKYILINNFFDLENGREYEGKILSSKSFDEIGYIKFYQTKDKKLIITKIEGNIEYTWNLIDLHTPLKIDPIKPFAEILSEIKPKIIGLIDLYTDPLSLIVFNSQSFYYPPLIYGYYNHDFLNKLYKGLSLGISYNNQPLNYSFAKAEEITNVKTIIKKIIYIGF